METVRCNLANLVARKGEHDGEKITIAQLSRDTGLALNTTKKYLRGGHDYFDGRTIAVLCRYLDCKIDELLEIVAVGESVVGDEDAET